MPQMARLMLTTVLVVLACVGGVALLVRLLEPRFAFLPETGERVTPREFGVPYEQLMIDTRDGERLRGWWLSRGPARARIVYFHGNGGNLSIWVPILAGVARHGYSVLAFDYRGYGLSSGRPTEQGLYRDVDAMLDWLSRERPDELPLIYWGRSLGAAMATYAATVRPPDGLILESGFPDARSLLRESPILAALSVFSTYRFSSVEHLQRLGKPVPALVIHGDDDHVVPIGQGRALFEAVREPKRFLVIHGGDHNDAMPSEPKRYWEAVEDFVRSLEQAGRGENVWHSAAD